MNLRSTFDTLDILPNEWLLERMRLQRDRLLVESDWAMASDAPTDKTAWAIYRKALRDFPATWEPSETADDLFEAVKLVANKLNIKVTSTDAKGGEKGYSAGGHINLTSDVEGAGRVSTMVHELAHELMHWKDKSKFYIGDEHKSNKALLELQAESVSYTVLAHYDIPTQHHATYLALWKANKETIERNLKIISEVSQFIVNEIDKVIDEQHIVDDEQTKTRVDEIITEMVNNLN